MQQAKDLLIAALLAFFAILPNRQAWAWELSLGAGVFVERSPYKGVQWDVNPLPLIQFESKYLFFDITSGGFYLYKGEQSVLSLMGDYLSLHFDPDNTKNTQMKGINKRYPALFGGLRYTVWGRFGIFKADIMGIIPGIAEGIRINAAYLLYFDPGGVDILPEAGFIWHSDKYNSYYYNVNSIESLRSGFEKYGSKGSFTPYIGVSAQYKFADDSLKGMLKVQYLLLPSEVTDSPIVDKNTGASFFAGMVYIF